MIELKPIDQQVVVLFGASSGIGRETALQFARRGARLVLAARSEPGLLSLAEEIRQIGGPVTTYVADTTDFEQVKAVAELAVAQFGRLDTWVHLAAVALYAPFEETTPEEFKRVIEVNLVGQAYGAMAALPHLRRTGRGALIHISSVAARRSLPLQSAYCAAKHGIDGFLESLRVELQHEGVPISVTNIMPAGINTPLFAKARTRLGVKPQPMPPVYEPTHVAEAILFAAEHPSRDLVVGGAAQAFLLGQRISPTVMDGVINQIGFKLQKTDEPRSVEAPDNLYNAIPGHDRVKGEFGDMTRKSSLYTWLETHPQARLALTGAALAGTALLVSRLFSNGDDHDEGDWNDERAYNPDWIDERHMRYARRLDDRYAYRSDWVSDRRHDAERERYLHHEEDWDDRRDYDRDWIDERRARYGRRSEERRPMHQARFPHPNEDTELIDDEYIYYE